MKHYKKGKNKEEELTRDKIPIEGLPENYLWMHVKGGTKVSNVVNFAKQALDKGEHRSIVWSGSGSGVCKTISCVEILKRSHPVHQLTRLCSRKVEGSWEPQKKGLETIEVAKQIPCIHILTSLDEIDKTKLGYQDPKAKTSFWVDRPKGSIDPFKNPPPRQSGESRRKFRPKPQIEYRKSKMQKTESSKDKSVDAEKTET